jgi:hypothetical protein
MVSVNQFLTPKLRLKVNDQKSGVARPKERKFLRSASRTTGASDASRRRLSTNSRSESGTKPVEQEGSVCRSSSRNSRHTFTDGADTSAFARPLGRSQTWKRGCAGDYACISGDSRATAITASMYCGAEACRSSTRRSRPDRRRGSGVWQDTRRFNRPYATTFSTNSDFPDSTFPSRLNPVEPPWYGPVCPVVWEGRC